MTQRKKLLKPRLHGEGQIRERSDGRLEYRFYVKDHSTGKSVRKSVIARTEKELLEKMRAAQIENAQGKNFQKLKITLEEWLTQHAESRKTSTRPNTQTQYGLYIKYISSIGKIPLQDVTTQILDNMYQEMARAGYSKSSITHTRSFINAAFKRAIKYGLLQHNPNTNTEIPAVQQTKIAKAVPQEEIHTLLEIAKTTRYYTLLYTIISTGMRHGEALGLKWSDFDWHEKSVTLERAVILVQHKVAVSGLKTSNSARTVYLHDHLIQVLQEHQQQQEALKRNNPNWTHEDWVFSTQDGKPLSQNNIRKVFKTLLTQAGLPNYRIHDLRHSFITYLIHKGLDPKTVSSIAGHADTRMTLDIYTQTQESRKRLAATEIAGFVSAQNPEQGANGGQNKKPRVS
ncbi:tyrosine-type recombinase/integrase [Deinococcus cellulosilyticus]|nr:site-specific integrase [Deinococcus cellulosilyticus]